MRPDIIEVSSRISDMMMKFVDSLCASHNSLERRAERDRKRAQKYFLESNRTRMCGSLRQVWSDNYWTSLSITLFFLFWKRFRLNILCVLFLIQSVGFKEQDGQSQTQGFESSTSVLASGAELKQSQGDRLHLIPEHISALGFLLFHTECNVNANVQFKTQCENVKTITSS